MENNKTQSLGLRERATELMKAARKLNEAADILEGMSLPNSEPIQSSRNGNRKRGKKTRKQQLKEFLLEHGPATWSDLLKQTGIPRGTLATLVGDKEIFDQNEGKWIVKG